MPPPPYNPPPPRKKKPPCLRRHACVEARLSAVGQAGWLRHLDIGLKCTKPLA
jgi:hypothetical protein